MTRERKCEGCDGVGSFGHGFHWTADCDACGGSGVVVESIPARDAVADAETLRWQWYPQFLGSALELVDFVGRVRSAEAASWTGVWREDRSKLLASRAARECFRAVPELRA